MYLPIHGQPHDRKKKSTSCPPYASRENSSVSPFGAARLMGRLASFHARPSGDFPVSDFPDLRTTTLLLGSVTFIKETPDRRFCCLPHMPDPRTDQSPGLSQI